MKPTYIYSKRKNALAIGIMLASQGLLSQGSAAQEQEIVAEEVIVTGVRKSLQDAMSIKRDAQQFVDAITAEDVGKLPDNNVAEAMQRVTGIQIERNLIGDGAGFQVRGLSQNRVEVNNQTLSSNSDSSRTNTFDTTSSALFKSIEVIKSPTADMVEGAIGATVRLKTFKPLDLDNRTTSLSIEGVDQEFSDKLGREIKALGSTKFDLGDDGELGLLLNLSQLDKNSVIDQGGGNWRPVSGGVASFDPALQEYSVLIPHRIDINRRDLESENTSINFAAQWAVNEDLEFLFQATDTDNQRIRDQKKFTLFPNRGHLRLTEFELEEFSHNANGNVIFADNMGTPFDGELKRGMLVSGRLADPDGVSNQTMLEATGGRELEEVAQNAFSLGVEWQISDQLFMESTFATSTSEYRRTNLFTTFQPRFYADNGNGGLDELAPAIIWDYGTGTDLPTWQPDFSEIDQRRGLEGIGPVNLNSVDDYAWKNIGGRIDDRSGTDSAFNIDFDYDIDVGGFTSIEFGARLSTKELDRYRERMGSYDLAAQSPIEAAGTPDWGTLSIYSQEWINGDGDPNNDVSRDQTNQADLTAADPTLANGFFEIPNEDIIFTGYSGDVPRRFPVVTRFDIAYWEDTLDKYFPGREASFGADGIEGTADDVTAINRWAWGIDTGFAFQLKETVSAAYLKANFEWETAIPITGNAGLRWVQTKFDGQGFDNEINEAVSATQTYDNLLPSLNLTIEIADAMFIRTALHRGLTRANPVDIIPSRDVDNDQEGESRGNPSLQPMETDAFDLAWEWYLNADTSLSAGIFHKKLSNFSKDNITIISGVDHDSDPATEPVDYDIRTTVNGDSGKINGFELSYQQVYSFLPSPLDGLGTVINYTETDSDQSSGYNQFTGENLEIPGLSSSSYNFILFWEKYDWSIRAAYNWRDSAYRNDTATRPDSQGAHLQDLVLTEATGEPVYNTLNAVAHSYSNPYGQLDLSLSYNWNDFTFFANARDFTNDPRTRSLVEPDSPYLRTWDNSGITYRFGVKWKGSL